MAGVKIKDKSLLDKLVAKLTLRMGRKPTQQEIVDMSIRMADEHFEELSQRLGDVPTIDGEKIRRIQEKCHSFRDVPWDAITPGTYAGAGDEDIYQ